MKDPRKNKCSILLMNANKNKYIPILKIKLLFLLRIIPLNIPKAGENKIIPSIR